MAKFRLTNKAVIDLSDIWDYTYDTWSEKQADKYYSDLINGCSELSKNPILGKGYEKIDNNLKGFKLNEHIIFYSVISKNEIVIERILHSRMDFKRWLNK